MMCYVFIGFICLILGIFVGGMIENYRARIVWGFPLGPEWHPPIKH